MTKFHEHGLLYEYIPRRIVYLHELVDKVVVFLAGDPTVAETDVIDIVQ